MTDQEIPERPNRFVLIGCSKSKNDVGRHRVTPDNLYKGQLFLKTVEYAERNSLPWAVLSARYGLWWSTTVLQTYDEVLSDQCPLDRAAWHVGVALSFLSYFDDDSIHPREITVEIHAGKQYAHPLAEILTLSGFSVELPCEGLGIGERLKLYTSGPLSGQCTSAVA